eukprot:CAMPEP_0169297962 /NCGR_PEP_ID=MMETSP1016-20121227/66104_1 /TAXON_ID=342587 /ORGANISM="Karlodinium micrum, Strain CCMP2283" /LENGTH=1244 /DNA_ID=CAMNT_0009389757 /DNA_START=267 /DNA_END=3998 /DNA_ORIENTATION=-
MVLDEDGNYFTFAIQGMTVAGIGRQFPHYAGDGGLARDATLWNPQGLALDASRGHLYVDNHVIRRIELGSSGLTGVIYRAAGDNVASLQNSYDVLRARFKYPWGIGLDANQSILYVADSSNNRIRKVNFATNEVTSIMGDDEAVGTGDGGPAIEAELDEPHAMLVTSGLDTAGGNRELLFEEFPKQRIRSLNLMDPDLTVDTALQTYALDFTRGDGLLGIVPRDYDAEVSFPYGIAGSKDGHLYIASYLYHRIRKTDLSSGITTTFAGTKVKAGFSGDGGPATSANIDGPTDVELDESGTNAGGNALFIVEGDSGKLRRVSLETHEITTLMSLPHLERLYSIAVDSVNQLLFVSSPTLHNVYRIALSGAVTLGDCAAPAGISNAASPSCTEGDIVRIKHCTPACAEGWVPSEKTLACYDGVLSPPTFNCEPGPCWAPSDLPYARWPVACQEGRQIESGQNCTALCAEGYAADRNLTCFAGVFTPTPTFQCCLGGDCATTTTTSMKITTTVTTSAAQLIDNSNPSAPETGDSKVSDAGGSVGGLGTYVEVVELSNVTVHGSFAFEVASFDLSAHQVTLLAATESLRAPLQKALQEVFEVSHEDVHIQAVQAVANRRLSANPIQRFNRFLQPAVHRITVVYAITRAPAWVENRVNSLGDPRSATSVQFAKALDNEGFGATLEQLSRDRDDPCQFPTSIEGAPLQSCEEGYGLAASGSVCTARCFSPRTASIASLECFAGMWSPTDTFECTEHHDATQTLCTPPVEIVGAAQPPCAEIQSGSASQTQWCTPVCKENLVPSEVGLACLLGKLSPSTFTCRQPYCIAPASVSMAESSPCLEGNQVPLGGQCTAVCKPGYAANANLTCERGVFSPPTFVCIYQAAMPGGDAGGEIWGPQGKVVTFSPPPQQLPTPGIVDPTPKHQTQDASNDSSSGLSLMIVVIVLTVLMVAAVSIGIGLVMTTLRRRAKEAKEAEDYQNAIDHISVMDSDEHGTKIVDNSEDHRGEEGEEEQSREEREEDGLDNLCNDEDDPDEISKQFDTDPAALEDEAIPDKNALQTMPVCVTPKRKAPRPPKVDKLDCAELLRLAQETAVVAAVSTGELSARSTQSRNSELDEWFNTVKSAAAGVAACDELFMNETHRANLQREAKFDALDDELAWSTNDDSRLHQLLGSTPIPTLGLGTNAEAKDDEGDKGMSKMQSSSLASQLLVRPLARPSQTESVDSSEMESSPKATSAKSSRKKGKRGSPR